MLINLKLLTMPNSFLLNIAEHENFSAYKYENANYCIVGIFIIISRENFMLKWVEHEKSFITLGPELLTIIVLNYEKTRNVSKGHECPRLKNLNTNC